MSSASETALHEDLLSAILEALPITSQKRRQRRDRRERRTNHQSPRRPPLRPWRPWREASAARPIVIAHLLGLPLDFSVPADLAERIKKWILSECRLAFGKDLSKDSLVIRRITDTAQRASLILSPTQDYEIDLPFITADSQGPKHFRRKLSYSLLQPE
jgi:hypothetical protein